MANFPFVVQPRLKPIVEKIGSEEAGYIECRRQGYLTVGEKAGVRQIIAGYDATADVIALSKKVAAFLKVDIQEAYQLVSDSITSTGNDPRTTKISTKYEAEFSALIEKMTQAAMFGELAKSFVLLLYRVEGASGITMESAADLHPDLIAGLSELYDDEEAKTVEKLREDLGEKEIEQVEEAEKK